jgi:hypothetical protein
MSDHLKERDGFDTRLAARFEQERASVPPDPFVGTTMRKVRAGRRREAFTRAGLRVATLMVAVAASPWLIAGVARLNAALESSLSWAMGPIGAWLLGALAVFVVLTTRLRRR